MIAFFLTWLRQVFTVDESALRVRLYLHHGLDLEAASDFWSALTDIPRSRFLKPYRAVADPSIRSRKHSLGCPAVTYYSAETLRAILGLADALLECSLLSGVAQLAVAPDC